jgi:quercetin dioxygenase-like cupin family protein
MRLNIEKETLKNNFYRKVLYTDKQLQVVLMSLQPYEEIGLETHEATQFIRVEEGNGTAVISNERHYLKDGVAIIVPKNKKHNVIAGKEGLKLYTIYSPPQHKSFTVEKEKK